MFKDDVASEEKRLARIENPSARKIKMENGREIKGLRNDDERLAGKVSWHGKEEEPWENMCQFESNRSRGNPA